MVTDEQIMGLAQFSAATLHESQGQRGALASCIKPIHPLARLVGRAFTVDCPAGDNLTLHYALTRVARGDVLIVDAKGDVEAGPWGDLMTLAAQQAGVTGLVIDGAVRDIDAIARMGFPVFARGVSIKGTSKSRVGRVNVPVNCAGIVVEPGDAVLGDSDGVVVVPAARVAKVMAAALRREQKENVLREKIRAGMSTFELLDLGRYWGGHDLT
jgi:4-hydroxy-4-methyl-2-oxoglutarate aldolase